MLRLAITTAAFLVAATAASVASAADLRAGAGIVDITPPQSGLGPTDSIRDPLFARAILVQEGKNCAVLVGLDQGAVRGEIAQEAIRGIRKLVPCPEENIIISATHTHSSSTAGFAPPKGSPNLAEAVIAAVAKAKSGLRPARIGFGTADVDLNVNRDLYRNGRWYQGINREGPSDKTLAVLQFVGEDGMPIGVYMNYAMHPIDFFLSGVVSADFPGDASRHVENYYGNGTVAIFAQGASGDQNPLLIGPFFNMTAQRSGEDRGRNDKRVTAPFGWDVLAARTNANASMAAATANPVPPERMEAYRQAIVQSGNMVAAMGAIIGETAIDVMRNRTPRLTNEAGISGAAEQLTCPGRDRLDMSAREGSLPPYKDGDPVNIRVGMLRIGDVYVATVNGEVYNRIATRLKDSAPVANLMVTTLANGMANSGYIYSDDAAEHLTFQVIGSRLKPGCAENKIIDASLRMIDRAGR